jgi:hypothetical protein
MTTFDQTTLQYIEHEVQIGILKFKSEDLYKHIDRLEARIDAKFNLLIVLIITSILIPSAPALLQIFHWAKG